MNSLIVRRDLIVVETGGSGTGKTVCMDYLRDCRGARFIPSLVTRPYRDGDPVGDYEHTTHQVVRDLEKQGELIGVPVEKGGHLYTMKKQKVRDAITMGGLHVRSITPEKIIPWYTFAGTHMIFVHLMKPIDERVQIRYMLNRPGNMTIEEARRRIAEERDWDAMVLRLKTIIPIHIIHDTQTIQEKKFLLDRVLGLGA